MSDCSYCSSGLVNGAKVIALFGVLAGGLAVGAAWGDHRGFARGQRSSVAWMANESAAALDIQSRGGSVYTTNVENGWLATVTIGGQTFEASSPDREVAILAAVGKSKGL